MTPGKIKEKDVFEVIINEIKDLSTSLKLLGLQIIPVLAGCLYNLLFKIFVCIYYIYIDYNRIWIGIFGDMPQSMHCCCMMSIGCNYPCRYCYTKKNWLLASNSDDMRPVHDYSDFISKYQSAKTDKDKIILQRNTGYANPSTAPVVLREICNSPLYFYTDYFHCITLGLLPKLWTSITQGLEIDDIKNRLAKIENINVRVELLLENPDYVNGTMLMLLFIIYKYVICFVYSCLYSKGNELTRLRRVMLVALEPLIQDPKRLEFLKGKNFSYIYYSFIIIIIICCDLYIKIIYNNNNRYAGNVQVLFGYWYRLEHRFMRTVSRYSKSSLNAR